MANSYFGFRVKNVLRSAWMLVTAPFRATYRSCLATIAYGVNSAASRTITNQQNQIRQLKSDIAWRDVEIDKLSAVNRRDLERVNSETAVHVRRTAEQQFASADIQKVLAAIEQAKK